MDVRKLYEEQMKKFFSLQAEIRNMVYVVFPASKSARIDDLHDARMLADKLEEAKEYLNVLLSQKNLRVNGEKERSKTF